MSVSLAQENAKNAVHPFCSFIAEMLMTLTKDRLLSFFFFKQIIVFHLLQVSGGKRRCPVGVPGDYQLTTEVLAVPSLAFSSS